MKKGTKVIINTDNDSYEKFFNKELIVTHASNKDNPYYDSTCYPEKLCELMCIETGEKLPYALYEWELKKL